MPGVLELAEDVLDELQRQLLAAGDQLALDRPRALVGGQHEHRPHRVVGFRGELHTRIVARPGGWAPWVARRRDTIDADGDTGQQRSRRRDCRRDLDLAGRRTGGTAALPRLRDRRPRRARQLRPRRRPAAGRRWPAADEVLPPVEALADRARRAARAAHLVRPARRAAHRLLGVRRRAADGVAADARPGAGADRAGPAVVGAFARLRDGREPVDMARAARSAPPAGCCTRSRARSPTRRGRGRWTPTSSSAPSTG